MQKTAAQLTLIMFAHNLLFVLASHAQAVPAADLVHKGRKAKERLY
jgi:hypothetical protein